MKDIQGMSRRSLVGLTGVGAGAVVLGGAPGGANAAPVPASNAAGSGTFVGRDWKVPHNSRVRVRDAELRYAVVGQGEPVLLIHGVNIADAILAPFHFRPHIFDQYRFISYYRAGYGGSTLAKSSLSIEEGAVHARQLLDHLGIPKAHIVGYSFGGVLATQFALANPSRTHTLTLLEAYLPRESPEAMQANTEAYLRANEIYQSGQKLAASQRYQMDICGPTFLSCVDLTCPLDVWDRVTEAADTVFTIDLPAYSQWGFRPSQALQMPMADRPAMPVLSVLGTDSEAAFPGFRETQQFILDWLPQAERFGVVNATHGLQIMNPEPVADAFTAFAGKHPI